MKRIAVLGITGSIGRSALEVIKHHPDKFQIVLASSHNNTENLIQIARELNISQLVITGDTKLDHEIDIPAGTKLYQGKNELNDLLPSLECDLVLNAVSGSAGLPFTIICLENDLNLALANKESLVMAGHIIKDILRRRDVNLIPVDSEHSAILQAIGSTPADQIKNLILTASGGPFRTLPLADFSRITPEQTLDHPTWSMGKKISVDSATMINKGLEVIEAKWLFDMKIDKIKVLIHPQSVIHSMVEMIDGSILAQMGKPSMQLPILYSFTFPERIKSDLYQSSVSDLANLSFQEVELDRFPLYHLARKVGESDGLMPTIMNAANEAAVQLFLERKISFNQISDLVRNQVQSHKDQSNPDLETIISTNKEIFLKTFSDYRHLI